MTAPHPIIPGVTFKDIEGFPGYCVGDDGSVWSSIRRISKHEFAPGGEWKRMKATMRPTGHVYHSLRRDGQAFPRLAHRLVLEAFVGPSPAGTECCHNDGNAANNQLSNLRWDTHRENIQDALKHGSFSRIRASRFEKLTDESVAMIGDLIGLRYSVAAIARAFGVAEATVRRIRDRTT